MLKRKKKHFSKSESKFQNIFELKIIYDAFHFCSFAVPTDIPSWLV